MTPVLDASALLAYLQGEPGADDVRGRLIEGACCSAVNWSEVAQKIRARGRDWNAARALLEHFGLAVEPVTAADGEWAAERWRPGEGLSLADRLCLALGARLGGEVWTAEQWPDSGVHRIR